MVNERKAQGAVGEREQQAQPSPTLGVRIFDRLSTRQQETLTEIATGHITTVTYESGPDYWGPTLVFAKADLAALREMGLINAEGVPRLTTAGLEEAGGVPDA